MRYFTLKATTAGRNLLEVDILLNDLSPLMAGIEEDLRSLGLFASEEHVIPRIVPSFKAPSASVTAKRYASTMLSDEDDDLFSQKEQGNSSRPIQALSVSYRGLTTKKTCVVTMSTEWLFRTTTEYLCQQVVRKGRANKNDPIEVSVFWQGQGPFHTPKSRSKMAYVLMLPDPMPMYYDLQLQVEEWPSKNKLQIKNEPKIEVTVTNRQSLATPANERSWHDYKTRFKGQHSSDDLRILIKQSVINQLFDIVYNHSPKEVEVGGFLLGDVYQHEKKELFIDISDLVLAENIATSFFKLRVDSEALQKAFQELRRRFPDKRRMGWYYIDLIGNEESQAPDGTGSAEHSIDPPNRFFSQNEVFLHRNFFPQPWHVALVLDTETTQMMFYQWKGNQIVSCQGYYAYD